MSPGKFPDLLPAGKVCHPSVRTGAGGRHHASKSLPENGFVLASFGFVLGSFSPSPPAEKIKKNIENKGGYHFPAWVRFVILLFSERANSPCSERGRPRPQQCDQTNRLCVSSHPSNTLCLPCLHSRPTAPPPPPHASATTPLYQRSATANLPPAQNAPHQRQLPRLWTLDFPTLDF